MICRDNSFLRIPLPEMCEKTFIGMIPETSGKPDWTPRPDQIPFAYDATEKEFWIFVSPNWTSLHQLTVSSLPDISLSNVQNASTAVTVPVAYDTGTTIVEGRVTLAELSAMMNSNP